MLPQAVRCDASVRLGGPGEPSAKTERAPPHAVIIGSKVGKPIKPKTSGAVIKTGSGLVEELVEWQDTLQVD